MVSHLLLQLPLSKGTRSVLTLDCRPPAQQLTTLILGNGDEDGMRRGLSLYDKYRQRDEEFELVSLFDYLTKLNIQRRGTARPLTSDRDHRLINYFPRYRPDGKEPENFYRVKVMLHHPFRDWPECSADVPLIYGQEDPVERCVSSLPGAPRPLQLWLELL